MRHLVVLIVCIGIFIGADQYWFRGEYSRELWTSTKTAGTDVTRWVQGTLDRAMAR